MCVSLNDFMSRLMLVHTQNGPEAEMIAEWHEAATSSAQDQVAMVTKAITFILQLLAALLLLGRNHQIFFGMSRHCISVLGRLLYNKYVLCLYGIA